MKKSSLQVNDLRVLVAVSNDDGFVELYESLVHNIIEKEQVNLVDSKNCSGTCGLLVAINREMKSSDIWASSIAFDACLIYSYFLKLSSLMPQNDKHFYHCFKDNKQELLPML